MANAVQVELLPASQVLEQTQVQEAGNGVRYASFGETKLTRMELEHMVGTVPSAMAAALVRRAFYFVPLTLGETEETMVAPQFTVELGDRAICHRNVRVESAENIFISTRLMTDRFGLSFEFFINAAHQFTESAGVPQQFADLLWSQATASVRGETSQDAWEARHRALGIDLKAEHKGPIPTEAVDERARTAFSDAAFSDTLAIYMLSLQLDFDYADLREREYPLLAAPALAERLRMVAALFPPNPGYQFQILYRPR